MLSVLLFTLRSQKTRSHFVQVPYDRSVSPSFGKSTNYNEVCDFLFTDLLDIVDFDLRNAIFTVGAHLRQQHVGTPIGGILSTVYAVLTCAFAEHKWVCSLGTDVHYFSSVRYVDDGAVAIAFSKS